jgi:hypothetical protein
VVKLFDTSAATPLSTSSQFCHHTFASFERAASSAITLLHPSKEQPVLLPHLYQAAGFAVTLLHPSNQQPFLLPHHFNKEPFLPSHLLQRAAGFTVTLLHPSNRQLFLLPTSSNEQPVLLPTSHEKLLNALAV